MGNTAFHKQRKQNVKHYIMVKALKHHFNLNWGDLERIVKEWKANNPKPDKQSAIK